MGAILIFAVRREPGVLDLDAVGLILILVGGIGMAVNHYVWERRKEAAELPFTLEPQPLDGRRPVPDQGPRPPHGGEPGSTRGSGNHGRSSPLQVRQAA